MALYGSAYPLLVGLFVLFNSASAPFSTERYYRVDPAPDVDCPYVRKRTSGIRETANSTDWNFTCGKEGRPRRVKGLLGRKNQPVRGEPAGALSAFCARSHEASRSFVGALEKDKALDERIAHKPFSGSSPRIKSQFLSQRHLPSLSMPAELG